MISIKDIISYVRYSNKVDNKFVRFGYWDRVEKKIIYRDFADIEQFTCDGFKTFTIDGKTVSSTAIRQSLSQGDVATVKRLMGHAFTVNGKVVSAKKRGYKLGFPTANLEVVPNQALPCNGVYATISHVDGKQFASATNIGTQPTFGDGQIQMETHLVGYKGNLLGKSLEVTFVQRLRDEKQFASPQELQIQIMKDIEQVKIVERRKTQ